MSQIRGRNTKPELVVRKFLFSRGYRYKLHDKKLYGRPDIVMPRYKTVIFINGCFWHSHNNCKNFVKPKTRIEFWEKKLIGNKIRDKKNISLLRKAGWKVITIWECQLNSDKIDQTLKRLLNMLKSGE